MRRITFAQFMAEALYDPERGYYVRHGAGRDYRSAPQTSPAFGHLIGRALGLMWDALGRPARFDVLELGAGDGRLAEQATGWLGARAPACAAALRYLAVDRGDARPLDGAARVVADVAALPVEAVEGCILSNELFDALPVHRLTWDGRAWRELWVVEEDAKRRFEVGELSSAALAPPVAARVGQIVELAPAADRVMAEIGRALRRGFALTIDYGGRGQELRGPHRMAGTLVAYYRHRASDDLLARPGEQDLTAHADFGQLERAGEAAGLRTVGRLTQRELLLGLGLRDWLGRLDPARLTPADLFNARAAAGELVDPGRLGKFEVLVQARGMAAVPPELSGALGQRGTK
ncbi:MAG TPA: SAM-dependent methyltransferase [Chloroflexota bacterium]